MTNLHGFQQIETRNIAELNTKATLYRHLKSGAELLSLENDDENKSFGIAFRTPPADSTGVAHIMEHSVLCGSRKYPVKEPFIELVKGSLKTFMNAFTYPDKTVYPVASQNTQDFYNLVDVYLDAVFFPNITPQTLQQEGWHYELDSFDGEMTFKGVVFNEMKGAYSSPDDIFSEYCQQAIFPDNTYGLDSGGHPKHIPDLTYAQFKEFHDTYYHPSNARLYFYGDDALESRLKIADEYLSEFDAINLDSAVPLQAKFDAPKYVTKGYAASAESSNGNKSMLAVNWLLPEGTDVNAVVAMGVLSYILVGTPASALRKALIDSGLGEDIVGGGTSTYLRQMTFATGLKGLSEENIDKVEPLIFETLNKLADEGVDPDMVEAALNTLEFRLREQNTGSFPRGLSLMLSSLSTWLYDGDPFAPLAFEAPLAEIKAQAQNPEFFPQLIREHLLDNTHRVTLTLNPDTELQARDEAEERARLDAIRNSLSRKDIGQIIDSTKELKKMQDTPDSPEALATIPHLTLDDLEKTNKNVPMVEYDLSGVKLLYHDLFTNGIIYLDVGFDLSGMPQEYLPYLGLFSQALTEIGTEREDFVKLSQRIGRKTGGVWASTTISALRDSVDLSAWMFLRGKSTVDHADDLLSIMRDVLLTVKLDNRDRFRQMVLEDKASQEANLIPSGHGVINGRLRAHFNTADWASEVASGVSNLFFVRRLADEIEKDWAGVLQKLEAMRNIILNRNNMLYNLTLDAQNWENFQPKLDAFAQNIPAQSTTPEQWHAEALPKNEGLTIPAQVNYVGKGANLYALGYKYHGSIAVISNLLRSTWLWERVRVQGGAYGGFSMFSRQSGVFTFLSYRDPNLTDTLDIYDQSAQFLRNLDMSQSELTKTIIGVIGAIDAYQLPDAKGYSSLSRYLINYTDEDRQRVREEVLSTTVADIKAFADVLDAVKAHGEVVVLGAADGISAANEARGEDWLSVKQVM